METSGTGEPMELRQLFDKESSTYSYLIADAGSREAIIIDPVIEQRERDLKLISDLGLKLRYAIDTHVHADHVSGLDGLRERTGCLVGISKKSGAKEADLFFTEGDQLSVGKTVLEIYETPGHTNGCLTYRMGDQLFTGDALLIRGCGRTDFQQGNAETLFLSITQKLWKFPDETKIYPAHDYKGFTWSTIGEEKRCNPRLVKSKTEFIDLMKNLNLPEPKMIRVAVPSNLRCGKPDSHVTDEP